MNYLLCSSFNIGSMEENFLIAKSNIGLKWDGLVNIHVIPKVNLI